ncbi:MAG: aspartate kinase [Muribaculaceae bacterium]|nr:aspartate kinase [Clostridia bacterium]MBP3589066.1 aspartate kinase [Muribaculaceae bacterium]MBQ8584504.1 aspartate kinase [Clostridia bacterium]
MGLKVLKFGGSSLADAAHFRQVAEIIKSEPQRRYIVASAPGKRHSGDSKITDLLYKCYALAADEEDITEVFNEIKGRYNDIITELGIDLDLTEVFEKIRLSVLHSSGRDYVASRGEYLNAMILAKYLDYTFIDAKKVIFFKEDGTFDSEKTNDILRDRLSRCDYAVIPGFYGSMPNGTIKTFSRGGSDITGSIVARAASATLYENWTDVSGFLMADPRIIDNPRVIETITYKELRELSYMGATVLHEDAIFPVRYSKIPINIRNTNKPSDRGTFIVPESDEVSDCIITGVAGRTGFSSITIEKDMMNSELGLGRKVLQVVEEHGISFEHFPSGIDTMTVIVSTKALAAKRADVLAGICKNVNPENIFVEENLALIAVVGRGMVKAKGTAARVFVALANAGVNIRMIDQGSSELNIIVGVDANDYIIALKAIYDEFVK